MGAIKMGDKLLTNAPFEDGSQVFIEMFLNNAKGSSKPKPLNVMVNHIQNFHFVEAQGRVGTFSMKLYDATFDDLEAAIFAGSALNPDNQNTQTATPVIQVQWGWINNVGEKTVSAPWEMRIVKYRSKFILGHGTELEIEGVAAPGLWTPRGNFFVEKGDSLRSLLTEVANVAGMVVDVDIEDGEFILTSHQNGRNLFIWIKNLIQYNLKSNSKNIGYEIFVKNTGIGKPTLVVKTQAPSKTTQTWSYLYGVDRDGQVLEYETEIQSNLMFGLGSGGFRTVFFDPESKETTEIYTNSKSTTGLAGEGKYIPKDSTTPPTLRIGFQNEETSRAFAASVYNRFTHMNVNSRLRVHGNPFISPSDLIAVTVLRGAQGARTIQDIHPTSGTYHINTVTHSISDGSYTTEIDLFRRGNITDTSGGSEKTSGSAAAINQATKVADIVSNTQREANRSNRASRLKLISKVKDPVLRAKYLEGIDFR